MKREENDLITRVGPGTPGGKMLRRYWHPIALSSQVPTPDCPPLWAKLLGERFVVFRDSSGKVGVLGDRCMHRGVSLSLGRVEEGGIRCIFHGWKFATDGNVLETPNDSAGTYVCKKKKQPAYPVREQSGLIWTYIGPPEKQPPFREFIFDKVPEANRITTRGNVRASYLALWEGGADSSHVGILHTNATRPNWGRKRRGEPTKPDVWDGLAPTYAAEDTDYGYRYVAFRPVPGRDDKIQIRISPELMPGLRVLAGEKGDIPFDLAIIETPMDDNETATFSIYYSATCPITQHADVVKKMVGMTDDLFDPATHNLKMSWPYGLNQDRRAMERDNWSGYNAIKPEDLAMTLSMGEDWDRTTENLVGADIAVVRLRRMLLRAIETNETGGDPPGLNLTDLSGVRSSFQPIGKDEDWKAY
ncbi:MAG TPA: Rieske 2Fe-2S domain-containing protein [Steroidobacteraceae bacterium]|nr:Rieske 2Fe-2S domain-containing protein [Steroidobacteraceae bacterium]